MAFPSEGRISYLRNVNTIQFTVNTSVTDVDLVNQPNPILLPDMATSSNDGFDPNENIYIEEVSLNLPYQFGIGKCDTGPLIILEQDFTLGGVEPMVDFGVQGVAPIAQANAPVKIETFVSPLHPDEDMRILGQCIGKVSMLNVPSVLNGLTLEAFVLLKVRHTRPMKGTT